MIENTRLIEVAFPLKQASLDSVHEKNVRHGHISTLHIWPARRPLAACRAALIATLLPDPGDTEERKKILEKLGGKVVQSVKRKKMPNGKIEEVVAEETVGGILHWGRESGPDLEWFKSKIREAHGGRAPKVLDPFAGGGAIPLEAMRLGCEVTATDINPVAWFILKCTLEYPQKLAGQKRPLPSFVLKDYDFMKAFFEAQELKGAALRAQLERLGFGENKMPPLSGMEPEAVPLEADLSWHVRAWGQWVFQHARADLERFYPVADGKPTVAYLWARTVTCKNCRATVPLLKTRWLCKKEKKRVALTVEPNEGKTGVVFGILESVPPIGDNAAQRREHDKRVGAGTMSRSGAACPCCGTIMTMEDLRLEGRAGRLETVITTVVVEGEKGKEYRKPTTDEIQMTVEAEHELGHIFASIPFGLPEEPLPGKEALGFRVPLYGFDKWCKLFTSRQLAALGTFVKHSREVREVMRVQGCSTEWLEAVSAYLAIALDRAANYMSTICIWEPVASEIKQTFLRFALPMTWDYAEANPLSTADRYYAGALSNVGRVLDQLILAHTSTSAPNVVQKSAIVGHGAGYDVIMTDPPYYDAIPYSDLMDFFYIWLRRTLLGISPEIDAIFGPILAPKWDHDEGDGELIDDAGRHGNDESRARSVYEDGMARAFKACGDALSEGGRLVVVFANKQPAAWETLMSAVIRSGFTVTATWPIVTEMRGGVRNFGRASLASSVWLVCRKRSENARPGWDNRVLEEMGQNISVRLRDFWDAGISGPDFVWAATGPALEAYSKYPAVKKANEPGQLMTVSEFLRQVRRIVVDFVVGRVLSHDGGAETVAGLDDVTTYYLLHRHDFGMEEAPAGACILYAISCGLSDNALVDQYDILVRTGGRGSAEDDEDETSMDETVETSDSGSGSKVKLKPWNLRKGAGIDHDSPSTRLRARISSSMAPMFPELEQPAPSPRELPLIDQIHRLMHLWKAGDVIEVDEYLDARGLRRSTLFHQLLQALIELAQGGSEERSLLESISNHVSSRGITVRSSQTSFDET